MSETVEVRGKVSDTGEARGKVSETGEARGKVSETGEVRGKVSETGEVRGKVREKGEVRGEIMSVLSETAREDALAAEAGFMETCESDWTSTPAKRRSKRKNVVKVVGGCKAG